VDEVRIAFWSAGFGLQLSGSGKSENARVGLRKIEVHLTAKGAKKGSDSV
jgi:hypothetical protein